MAIAETGQRRLSPGTILASMDGDMTDSPVAFYFDPSCPWTWNTSRWLVEAAHARGFTVDWRPLSLSVLNAGREIPARFRPTMEVGHAALRLVSALRAAGLQDRVGDLYTELGRRLFHDREEASMALVAAAADAVGVGDLASAATDTSLDAAVEESTREAIGLGGPDVGSPIVVVGDAARGFHGPIVSPPPSGEDALRLWDAVAAFARVPGAYEIKHGREGGVTFGPRP
jgi:protein-disulfide isomerase